MKKKAVAAISFIIAVFMIILFVRDTGIVKEDEIREFTAFFAVLGEARDEDNEIIGYQFVSLGKMTDFIKKGDDPNTAWEKAKGQYGRVADAVKIIDPRQE